MLPVGTVLNGVYKIVSHIASGGFGNTYVAVTLNNNTKVAVKEFFMKGINEHDDAGKVLVKDEDDEKLFYSQRDKFQKEAQTLACLKNSHIVGVFDAFIANNTAYYIMEFVDGENLSQIIKKSGKLSENDASLLFLQIIDALYAIHQKGVLHLDIKPANVLVDKEGQAKIIDFGASKIQNAGNDTIASFTPAYAPLELQQQNSAAIGPWTDIYSAGATYYFMLTGKKPPQETDIVEKGRGAFLFDGNVNERNKRLIVWMMQPVRSKRPQNVQQVISFLTNPNSVKNEADEDTIAFSQKGNSGQQQTTTVYVGNRNSTPQYPYSNGGTPQTAQWNMPAANPSPQPQVPKKKSKTGCVVAVLLILMLLIAVAAFFLYQNGFFDRFKKDKIQPLDTIEETVDQEALARQREMEFYDMLTGLIDSAKQEVENTSSLDELENVISDYSSKWDQAFADYEGVELNANHQKIINRLSEELDLLADKKIKDFEKAEIENDSCDINIPIEQTVDSGGTEEEIYDEAPEESSDLGDELIQMLDSILQ